MSPAELSSATGAWAGDGGSSSSATVTGTYAGRARLRLPLRFAEGDVLGA